MGHTQFFQDFLHLFFWNLALLGLKPFSLLVLLGAASAIVASVVQKPFSGGGWRRSDWLILTQLLFAPALLIVGVLYSASENSGLPQQNSMGQQLLSSLFYLSIVTAVFWLYRTRKQLWLSASLLAVLELLVIGAGFAAAVSISGNWL